MTILLNSRLTQSAWIKLCLQMIENSKSVLYVNTVTTSNASMNLMESLLLALDEH